MFTGIVQEVGIVAALDMEHLIVDSKNVVKRLKPGDSIAINGACMTVNKAGDNSFSVDIMPETIRRTNLGRLKKGDRVNLELPVTIEGNLGGHIVQGHVDSIGVIRSFIPEKNAVIMKVETPDSLVKYIVEKGFIAVDGVSLTVTAQNKNYFEVSLVDFTRNNTNLGLRRAGDAVNLEVDIIAKYVEKLLISRKSDINYTTLERYGYIE